MVGKGPHRSEYIFPSLFILGSTFVQNTTLFFLLYSRSVSGGFSLVDFIPCLLMCKCPIVVFLDFYRCLLISFLVRLGHIFRYPCLMALMILAVVGLNSAACEYCDSSGFDAWPIILLITAAGCWVSRVTSHISVFLFLVPLMIYCPLLWTDISCFSSVMVQP